MQRCFEDRPLPGSAASGRRVTVNVAESAASWLHARGLIDERQWLAAEALRRDFEKAGLSARVTMVWDAPPQGRTARGAPDPAAFTHVRMDAHRRFHGAMDAAGAGLSSILWRTICAGEGMAEAERALGWPVRSGRVVLALALDRVADYHRIPGG